MRFRPDPFIVMIVAVALTGSFLPARGGALDGFQVAAKAAIALLFFVYGARLSTAEAVAGLRRWKLHLAIVLTTFAVFPLLGWAAQVLRPDVLSPGLYTGVLLLCLVPSTVQSSVAFTSIAGGNVAGAVVSASLSNMLGVFVTPALVALMMSAGAQVDAGSVLRIVMLLLAPFVAGQLSRPLIGRWVSSHDRRLRVFDRTSILFVVYVAFSEGANAHVWQSLDARSLVVLVCVCAALLAAAIGVTIGLGRLLRMPRADRLPLLFCGCNKSLASGLPMASVLFAGGDVALVILPLMLYHQFQLIVCSWLAGRLGRAAA